MGPGRLPYALCEDSRRVCKPEQDLFESCPRLEALNLDFFSCRISCLLVLSRAITWQIMAKLWVWTAGCK